MGLQVGLLAVLLVSLSVFLQAPQVSSTSLSWGMIRADNITFDKIVGRRNPALVLFDSSISFGENYTEFVGLAKMQEIQRMKMLFVVVPISDREGYAEGLNRDLAERFGFIDKHTNIIGKKFKEYFPRIVLFSANNGPTLEFTGPIEREIMARWLCRYGRYYMKVGAAQIPMMENLAEAFMHAEDIQARKKVTKYAIKQARTLVAPHAHEVSQDARNAMEYVELMKKGLVKGPEHFEAEFNRVMRVLKTGTADKTLTLEQRGDMRQRLSLLSGFLRRDSPSHAPLFKYLYSLYPKEYYCPAEGIYTAKQKMWDLAVAKGAKSQRTIDIITKMSVDAEKVARDAIDADEEDM